MKSLCLEKSVPLIDVPDHKALEECAGLCSIDKDGNPRKVKGGQNDVIGERSTASASSRRTSCRQSAEATS